MRIKIILTILFVSSIVWCKGQNFQVFRLSPNTEILNSSDFRLLKIDSTNLCGVYNFGDSESEVDVIIQSNSGSYVVQICGHSFIAQNSELTIVPTFRTYNSVIIDSFKIQFGKYSANITDYFGDDYDNNRALLINGILGESILYASDTAEVGFNYATVEEMFEGYPYPQIFYNSLDANYLDSLSLDSLILMKNSIYARYGYIFKKNLEMIEYFKNKSWYTPAYDKVDQWFTLIEKRNLKIILKCIKNK
jgi:hypothetical protein